MASEIRWLPQDAVLVRFGDDPALLHCRGVLRPVRGDDCFVVTPDRDVERTTLEVWDKYTEVKRIEANRLPVGVRDDDTYLPRHSEKGAIGSAEMRGLVAKADRLYAAEVGRVRIRGKLDADGQVAGQGLGEPSQPEVTASVDTRVWVVVYRTSGGDLGEEITPPADSPVIEVGGKSFKLFSLAGEEFLVRGLALKELDSFKAAVRVGQSVGVDKEERDVRILPVVFDSGDERFRTVSEAVAEFDEVEFDDFPLQGPRTILHDCRQLRRMGLDFLLHHDAWLKKSGVRASDRSVHEHSSVCRALHFMMVYDQLNLPALASAEALNTPTKGAQTLLAMKPRKRSWASRIQPMAAW